MILQNVQNISQKHPNNAYGEKILGVDPIWVLNPKE